MRSEASTNSLGNATPSPEGQRFVAFDMDVTNNSGEERSALGVSESRIHVGSAELHMDVDAPTLPTTFLPGDRVTSTHFVAVDCTAKQLRITAGLDMGQNQQLQHPVRNPHFRGPLPQEQPRPASGPAEEYSPPDPGTTPQQPRR
ncbi:hypothetical protein [Actinopolyspora lacussalsi]|uniref:hypothetical protein n=1 Tax=Actinopolyspora righensis TaxID=995060 RepID=UPI0011143CF7|nr:hypothetical protein [Actinopolyspora righensis]